MFVSKVFIFLIFLCSFAQAGVPQAANIKSLGGSSGVVNSLQMQNAPAMTVPSGSYTQKTITCAINAAGTNNFNTCADFGAGVAAYQVPAGQTFHAHQFCGIASSVSPTLYTPGWSTAALNQTGSGTATKPTGAFCMDGTACTGGIQALVMGDHNIENCYNMEITFGATTYMWIQNGASGAGLVRVLGEITTP